jgi:DNA-binding MarR family transcriptional regulator
MYARPVGAGDSASGTAVPSDAELAGFVEHLVGELWWKVSSELPTELSRTAASILKYLREHGPQRVTSLATREQVAQPTMSVILKRLGARGLVERRVDPDDRRATLVAITPLGLETLSERARLRSGWFASRLAGLEGDDRRAVAAAVSKLMETLG